MDIDLRSIYLIMFCYYDTSVDNEVPWNELDEDLCSCMCGVCTQMLVDLMLDGGCRLH